MKRGRRQQNQLVGLLVGGAVILGLGWILWPRGATPTEQPEVVNNSTVAPTIKMEAPPKPPQQNTPRVTQRTPPKKQDEVLAPRPSRTGNVGTKPGSGTTLAADTRPKAAPGGGATPVSPQERIASRPEIERALRQYQGGQKLAARTALNNMLGRETDPGVQRELRRHLESIAREMVFSKAFTANDDLCRRYVIKGGDSLDKIASAHRISADLLANVNGIKNKNLIRAGQTLKVPVGPFNAVVFKSSHRLDLYLQGLYVKSMPVGLGQHGSTPTGTWAVTEKLVDPTYYPPPSAEDRSVIKGGDPRNPLGGFWIGLEGLEGEAVGQPSYGIHGTIEPGSIGKDSSLGCIRMLDDDISLVYSALSVRKSKVAIYP